MYSIQDFDSFLVSWSKLGFPWADKGNANKMIKKFLDYDPKIRHQKYRLKSFRPNHGYYLPPLFRGEWTIVPSGPEVVKELDTLDTLDMNLLTDCWTEKLRMSAKKYGENAPIDMIDLKETKLRVFELLVKENPGQTEVSADVVRQAFSFITHETRNFRLTWIKGILIALDPEMKNSLGWKGKKWLDISTGWGDRPIAATLLGMEYLGFDPNTKLNVELQHLISDLQSNTGKDSIGKEKIRTFPLPFESLEAQKILKGEEFDLILSSPPFFQAEIYCQEETQSDMKYQEFNDWMTKFLFKSLEIAWQHLKPGGYMCLYVGDPSGLSNTQHSSQTEGICEPMNLFIETFPESNYEGVLGIENDIGVIRPCWIWRKTNESRKLWKPYVKRSLKNDYPKIPRTKEKT